MVEWDKINILNGTVCQFFYWPVRCPWRWSSRFLRIRMRIMWLWHRFFSDAQSSKTTKLLAFKVFLDSAYTCPTWWQKFLGTPKQSTAPSKWSPGLYKQSPGPSKMSPGCLSWVWACLSRVLARLSGGRAWLSRVRAHLSGDRARLNGVRARLSGVRACLRGV